MCSSDLTRKRTVDLDDLAHYEWILPQQGTPRRRSFERMFEGTGCTPKSSVETRTPDLQATLIGASDRITMMSAQEVRRIAVGGTIVALDYKPGVARGHDGVATRADWHPTASNRLFLEILRRHGIAAGATGEPAGELMVPSPIRRKRQEIAISA